MRGPDGRVQDGVGGRGVWAWVCVVACMRPYLRPFRFVGGLVVTRGPRNVCVLVGGDSGGGMRNEKGWGWSFRYLQFVLFFPHSFGFTKGGNVFYCTVHTYIHTAQCRYDTVNVQHTRNSAFVQHSTTRPLPQPQQWNPPAVFRAASRGKKRQCQQ